MSWYKYREKMTHGSWEYIHLNCSLNEVEEYIREYLMAWQDEWRGVEVKHVPVPPKHVLFNHINIARNKLEFAQENLTELLKQSRKYYKHIPDSNEAQKVYDDFIKKNIVNKDLLMKNK